MEELTTEEIVLAGMEDDLGRRQNRARARSASNTKPKLEVGASRVRKQFIERIHLLPKDVQKALKEGKASIADSPYYSTGAIQGTRAELIKVSTSEELGKTNIDNGKLGKDKHLILSGFKLLYDATSESGSFTDIYPADLLNGEWEFEVNGKKMFEKMDMRKFFSGFVGYDINKPFGLYMLDNPKVIEPQKALEFNVNLPAAVPGYLKVHLVGTNVFGF